MIELGCGEQIHYTYAETEANNPKAMNKMLQEHGVEITLDGPGTGRVPEGVGWRCSRSSRPPILPSRRSPTAILPSARTYKPWGDAQFLKPTYLSQ